ncbi:hypothetical protein D3C86_2192270 [compost metagenome]
MVLYDVSNLCLSIIFQEIVDVAQSSPGPAGGKILCTYISGHDILDLNCRSSGYVIATLIIKVTVLVGL